MFTPEGTEKAVSRMPGRTLTWFETRGVCSGASGKESCLPMQEMQEMWVQSPGGEDPLEKQMAAHSGNLAWRIPWTEEPGGLQSMGSQRVGHD